MKRREISFSKTAIAALEPEGARVRWKDTKTPGLEVFVTPKAKTFYLVRRVAGMGRRSQAEYIRLGVFPGMKVEEARAEARKRLRLLNAGESVRAKINSTKEESRLSDLWEWWYEERAMGPNPGEPIKSSWKKDQQLFDNHLAKDKGRRISELNSQWARKLFRAVTKGSGPVRANHVKRLGRAMWNHGRNNHGLTVENPWQAVKDNREESRESWVTPDQMPALFAAIAALENRDAADFFLLCLFTGARQGNVRAMRWRQLDLSSRTWTIPSSHHKNRRTHSVPLPPPAVEIIESRRGLSAEWVFPSYTGSHIAEPFRAAWKSVLDQFAEELELAKPPDLRVHDLRHTTASWLVNSGASLPMVGKVLGHAAQATTARYAHLANDPVRDALDSVTAAMGEKNNG